MTHSAPARATTLTQPGHSFARPVRVGLALVLAAALLALLLADALEAGLLSQAAGVESGDRKGIGGLVRVADAIERPAMFACFSILPLALLGGGALTMIGNPRGPRILGFGVGGAMILAAVSGFAA